MSVIKSAWSSDRKKASSWTDIPAIEERRNTINGHCGELDYYRYVAERYLKPFFPLTGLSLGCGTGDREVLWFKQCSWKSLVGYDISESRIREANARINKYSYPQLDFQVCDINHVALPQNYYDIILGEDAIHHFTNIDYLFASIAKSLKPSGFFILNDFIGPSKFQWTDRQLEIVNALLHILPKHYRIRMSNNKLKTKVYRPSRLRMQLMDPSEAAESSEIKNALFKYFDVIEIHNMGGTILMQLLNDIAHNFRPEDDIASRIIQILISIEDNLIKSNDIESDFIFAICRALK
ncbi:MAG: class I SAM-dependent methyltransferase [Bacteroidales bacterium]|nr:class I SAM-dependent methyltransferase [Bacteroidales bacterium]